MAKKENSYLGRAGQLAAMAELLLLGYNVAIPEVDFGDDIFVVDDQAGNLWRVQVKTAVSVKQTKSGLTAQYLLPRTQLQTAKRIELYYVFALRRAWHFDFVVCSRPELFRVREAFELTSPKEPTAKKLNLGLLFTAGDVLGWGISFLPYLRAFARYFPKLAR